MQTDPQKTKLSRRAFVYNGTLFLSAAGLASSAFANSNSGPRVKAALITDLHFADKDPAGSRHYRETLSKLREAKSRFAKEELDFIVELGDLIDAADSVEVELKYLDTVNREFSSINEERHYVLGNHCVQTLTKDEFLKAVSQDRSFYSFDKGHIHFVVLDACFRKDGEPYGRNNFEWTDSNIPQEELDWLKEDLDRSDRATIVFVHQRLDVDGNHGVKNNADVRKILEESKQVLAVFQGHSHQNDLKEINGIPYCTLVAMVEGSGDENNAYSTLTIFPNRSIQVTGFRKQKTYAWDPTR